MNELHWALDESRERRAGRVECAVIHQRIDSLTPREYQVLELVVTGMLNKQVAGELGAAEKTIKVHRAGSWRKCTPTRWWTWSG